MRIVYGWYLSAAFMRALFAARAELSDLYLVVFCLGNLTLNALNLVWCVSPRCCRRVRVLTRPCCVRRCRFYKMIFAVRKRFDKEAKPLTADSSSVRSAATNGSANGHARSANGNGAAH